MSIIPPQQQNYLMFSILQILSIIVSRRTATVDVKGSRHSQVFPCGFTMCVSLLICVSACNSGQTNPQGYTCDPSASGGSSCDASINFASGVAQPAGTYIPSIIGYRTDLLIARSTAPGDGRIGNSMRLIGSATSLAYLEIGYFNIPHVGLNCGASGAGLWYYVEKLEAGVQTLKCVQTVPAADLGKYATLEISSVGPDPTQPTSFKVSITTPNTTIDLCSQVSCTNVLWTAGSSRFANVELKETLFGKSGASASSAIFKNNSYEKT